MAHLGTMLPIRRAMLIFTDLVLIALASSCRSSKNGLQNLSSRDGWQLPDQVLKTLDIRPGQKVADNGSGDGYCTFRLAEKLGASRTVFAVEIDEKAVDRLREKAAQPNHHNITVVSSEPNDPRLLTSDIDLAFLSHSSATYRG